jgi:hypothetical protein
VGDTGVQVRVAVEVVAETTPKNAYLSCKVRPVKVPVMPTNFPDEGKDPTVAAWNIGGRQSHGGQQSGTACPQQMLQHEPPTLLVGISDLVAQLR